MFSRSIIRLSQNIAPVVRHSSRGYADAMSFTFASQAQVLYDAADVKQVDVPSFSGTFGILPAHVPSLAVLSPGVVTVFQNDGVNKKYFVSSGIVTINDDSSVQILAEEAVNVEDLDLSAAKEQLSLAISQASGGDEVAVAKAQIAQEVAEQVIKAAESG